MISIEKTTENFGLQKETNNGVLQMDCWPHLKFHTLILERHSIILIFFALFSFLMNAKHEKISCRKSIMSLLSHF